MEAAAWQPGYVMEGGLVNRKRVQRLMQLMGLEAIYPKPNLSKVNPGHKKYPYLLRVMEIIFPDHVWSTDITYIKLLGGFAFVRQLLTGIVVMSLHGECLTQLTAVFVWRLLKRLWRSLKYKDVYLKEYESVKEARQGIAKYFSFYNNERLHQSLSYRCRRDVYLEEKKLGRARV